MSRQPANPTARQDEEYDLALTTLEESSEQINLTPPAVEEIVGALDQLFAQGADVQALEVIQDNAGAILDVAHNLDQAYRTAMALAAKIKAQRDENLAALDGLKTAIRTHDFRVPEIEDLIDEVQEYTEVGLMETWWDYEAEIITERTPLSWDEASRLLDILTDDTSLDPNSSLWDELRDWIAAARTEAYGD